MIQTTSALAATVLFAPLLAFQAPEAAPAPAEAPITVPAAESVSKRIERSFPLTGLPGVGDAVLRVRIVPKSELLQPLPEEASDLELGAGVISGFSDASVASSVCCSVLPTGCDPVPGFQSGDELSLNYYWSEVIPQDPGASWPVALELALGLPSGNSFTLFTEQALELGDLSQVAGLDVLFCVSLGTFVPDLPQGYGFVDQIHTVSTPQAVLPRVISGGFNVN